MPAGGANGIGGARPIRKRTAFTREWLGAIAAMLIDSVESRIERYERKMEANESNECRANVGSFFSFSNFESTKDKKKRELWREIRGITEEIEKCNVKMQENLEEHGRVEMEFCNVNQLKDKGLFVLKDIQTRNEELREDLKKIHWNYVTCRNKATHSEDTNDIVSTKIEELTAQRDSLKKELADLQKDADENTKKLADINVMIKIQEKKNMALLRKLKRRLETVDITPDLKERVNAILNDPRIVESKNNNDTNSG